METIPNATLCFLEFFYGGESLEYDQAASYAFVCPYCGKHGLTDGQLYNHVLGEHSNSSSEVVGIELQRYCYAQNLFLGSGNISLGFALVK